MLVLRVLRTGPLHGTQLHNAIRQAFGFQYSKPRKVPSTQPYSVLLMECWVRADGDVAETNRRVRLYELTGEGRKRLKRELLEYKESQPRFSYSSDGMKGMAMRKTLRRIHHLIQPQEIGARTG